MFAVIPSVKKAGLMIIIAVMNIFSAETCVISGYGVPEKVMSRRKRGEENEAKKMRRRKCGNDCW
jgi:hypothetical protein